MSKYVVRPSSEVTHYTGWSYSTRAKAESQIARMVEDLDRSVATYGQVLVRPFTEAWCIVLADDPRDARIAELEAALAAERAVSDAQKARADEAESALQEGVEILAEQRRRHADDIVALNAAVAWQTSAQRIANCAVSAIEYLRVGDIECADDVTVSAANAGVDLVVAALKEMQS